MFHQNKNTSYVRFYKNVYMCIRNSVKQHARQIFPIINWKINVRNIHTAVSTLRHGCPFSICGHGLSADVDSRLCPWVKKWIEGIQFFVLLLTRCASIRIGFSHFTGFCQTTRFHQIDVYQHLIWRYFVCELDFCSVYILNQATWT